MEDNKIDLNSVDLLFNPTSSDGELGADEIKVVYEIIVDMLPENNIIFLTSVLHSFKENSKYVGMLLKEDALSSKGIFLNKILKALNEQYEYKSVVVYDNILHIEETEFQQFYFEEINDIKFILQEVIKKTIFNTKKENINRELNKTIALILQQLSKSINLVISKKGQTLFGNGNIKDTLIAITELISKTSKNSFSLPSSAQQESKEDVFNAEVIDTTHMPAIQKPNMKEMEALILTSIENGQEKAVKTMTAQVESAIKMVVVDTVSNAVNKAVSNAVDNAVSQTVLKMEESFEERLNSLNNETAKKIGEVEGNISKLAESMSENNQINGKSYELISGHIEEQQAILQKYKEKLRKN